ncbi:MAG: flagellar M-ring protein FliF C-terminal domain-containing protein, partial [Verrucomicrobiota bacterium]
GVSSNVPEKAQLADGTTRPSSSSDQNRKNRTMTYEINRTLTNTTRSPGTVKSLTAAVFIAPRLSAPAKPAAPGAPAVEAAVQKRTAEELTALRQVVINALGLKPGAGQSLESMVSLQEMSFQTVETIPAQMEALQTEGRWQGWFAAASRWAAVAGAVAIFFIFWRTLAQQKPEPVPVEVLAMTPEAASRALPKSNQITPELLNELIRQKPANIGIALRDWVSTSAPGANNN